MSRVMNVTAVFCFLAMIFFGMCYRGSGRGICLTLAVTFGTIAYHFGMRLLVGELFNVGMKNRADLSKKWYRIHSWERKLYRCLKVKKWKARMPTFRPDTFSNKKHTWAEIAQAMCQAEFVHEVSMVLSFVPLAASLRFGSFWVFFITSVCSAVFDFLFVMMQRYNRSRIVSMILRQRQNL